MYMTAPLNYRDAIILQWEYQQTLLSTSVFILLTFSYSTQE